MLHDKAFIGGDNQTYYNPPAHPNCILPGNKIIAPGGIVATTKAFYEGRVIEITTVSGSKITVTENHPILRGDGTWVHANKITKHDDLISCINPKGMLAAINPDMDYRPTPIEDIHESFAKKFNTIALPVSSSDFHGDGKFIKGDVDIVKVDGFLLRDFIISITQHIRQFVLRFRNIGLSYLFSKRPLDLLFSAYNPASSSNVGGGDLGGSFLGGHISPFHSFGFRLGSGNNTSLQETLAKSPAVDPKLARQFILRFASDIAFDEVVDVRNSYYSGHVYNLQIDPYSLYFCNYITVSNCRCWTSQTTDITESEVLQGEEENPFEDSKVKEKVYHGTNAVFDEFDPSKRGSETDEGWLGQGFYFSSDPRVPVSYNYTLETYLDIKKPLNVYMTNFKQVKRDLVTDALNIERGSSSANITKEAIKQGYDGIVLDYSKTGYISKEVVVYDPKQIIIESRVLN